MDVPFDKITLGSSPLRPTGVYTEAQLAQSSDPVPAVYILYNADECMYVGQTKHLRARLRAHSADKEWTRLAWYEVPAVGDRLRLEGVLILALRPRLNKGLALGFAAGKIWDVAWAQYARASRAKRRGATAPARPVAAPKKARARPAKAKPRP